MTAVKVGVHTDPFVFWMNYYKIHDESPGELHETVRLLGANRRMRDVEAALKGYLWNRGSNAEAWMYRALAMAIQMNQGSPADVKISLNYAADLAQKSHNPNDLVSVADTLLLMGHLERVGALLDEAASRVPHHNDPLEMSAILAQRLKDPVRMGRTIEKLLSLGWPGEDEYVRDECRRHADALSNALREEGRTHEASALMDQLKASLGRDVYIRLTWDGYADFDLAVNEPLGVTASYDLPRTVFGGSIIKNGFGAHPDEIYVCPRGFDGDYTVHIRTIFADEKKPVVQLKLETIVHEGTAQEHKDVHILRPDELEPDLRGPPLGRAAEDRAALRRPAGGPHRVPGQRSRDPQERRQGEGRRRRQSGAESQGPRGRQGRSEAQVLNRHDRDRPRVAYGPGTLGGRSVTRGPPAIAIPAEHSLYSRETRVGVRLGTTPGLARRAALKFPRDGEAPDELRSNARTGLRPTSRHHSTPEAIDLRMEHLR